MPTTDDAVAAYRKLRDYKKAMQAKHKEELAPINEKMKRMEGHLLAILNAQGEDTRSIGTKHGTLYASTRTSATVEDFDALIEHIREHDSWGLLERRVSTVAVDEYIEAHGDVPPGVKITRMRTVNVRAS